MQNERHRRDSDHADYRQAPRRASRKRKPRAAEDTPKEQPTRGRSLGRQFRIAASRRRPRGWPHGRRRTWARSHEATEPFRSPAAHKRSIGSPLLSGRRVAEEDGERGGPRRLCVAIRWGASPAAESTATAGNKLSRLSSWAEITSDPHGRLHRPKWGQILLLCGFNLGVSEGPTLLGALKREVGGAA